MAFIRSTSPEAAQGDVRAMYERQQSKLGYVPNYAKVFSHRPELMTLWAKLLSGIRRNVEPRRFELVTLAAAHALRNSYCSLAHGKALTEFYTAEDVQAIVEGEDLSPLSEGEAAIVRFARKVAHDAAAITSDDIAALKKHGLDDREIFDIVAITAARAFFTKIGDALGVEPDVSYMEMGEPLRQALTVGRAIGWEKLERLR